MLPETGNILRQDFKIRQKPSKTYRLDLKNGRITGKIDGLEAVRQSVYCILNTERFDWLIYSWNYGCQWKDLLGQPMDLVQAKLKKRIREALAQDQRIRSVEAFSFTQNGKGLTAAFTVKTGSGDFNAEKEVEI